MYLQQNDEAISVPINCVIDIKSIPGYKEQWVEKKVYVPVKVANTNRDAFLMKFQCPNCSSILIFQVFLTARKVTKTSGDRFISGLKLFHQSAVESQNPHTMYFCNKEAHFDENHKMIGHGGASSSTFVIEKIIKAFDRKHPYFFTEEGLLSTHDFPLDIIPELTKDELSILLVENPEQVLTVLSQMPNGPDLLNRIVSGGKGIENFDPVPSRGEMENKVIHSLKRLNSIEMFWAFFKSDFKESLILFPLLCFCMTFTLILWSLWAAGFISSKSSSMVNSIFIFGSFLLPFICLVPFLIYGKRVIEFRRYGLFLKATPFYLYFFKLGLFSLAVGVISLFLAIF